MVYGAYPTHSADRFFYDRFERAAENRKQAAQVALATWPPPPTPTKKWTVMEIKEMLKKHPVAVEKALVRIYQFQTASERAGDSTSVHNGVGFNALDAKILSSFAEWILTSNCGLTAKQLAVATRKITKYAKQLAAIANGEVTLPTS